MLAPSAANPGNPPGAMSLYDMQCAILYLLREDGPDTGYPLPTAGDFNAKVLTRDINIAIPQLISDAGLPPSISDRMDTFPVLPLLDHPVPLGLTALQRIEYTPAGQQLYKLTGLSFNEWDKVFGGILPSDTGQPFYYREPYAGYVRLQPAPGPGNASGPGIGTIALNGAPTVGDLTHLTVSNQVMTVVTPSVVTGPTDTTSTLAFNLSNALNNTMAVQGGNAFLSPSSPINNEISLTALLAPGTNITYKITTSSATMPVSPTTKTYLSPNGDMMTWYYSTLGMVLVNPGDTPGIPPQFHMGIVYRVLGNYWLRKQDFAQAKEYMNRYQVDVMRAKAFPFDSNRADQPSIGGDDDELMYPSVGGW